MAVTTTVTSARMKFNTTVGLGCRSAAVPMRDGRLFISVGVVLSEPVKGKNGEQRVMTRSRKQLWIGMFN